MFAHSRAAFAHARRSLPTLPPPPPPPPAENELCNCEFSLAYGGKILLQDARLRLVRGRRYGLCGANGVGKVRRHVPHPHPRSARVYRWLPPMTAQYVQPHSITFFICMHASLYCLIFLPFSPRSRL